MRNTYLTILIFSALPIVGISAWAAFETSISFRSKTTGELLTGSAAGIEYSMLREHYKSVVLRSGAEDAIDALETDSGGDAGLLAVCHDLLHEIGRAAYGRYGTFKESVSYQSEFCNSGYLHGVFEAYMEDAPRSAGDLRTTCNELSEGKSEFERWQCYHGIGHGLMYLYDGELSRALGACVQLENGAASCANGAYMEIFNAEMLEGERAAISEKDPFATCALQAFAKEDCYVYVPTYLSQALGMDYPEMLNGCRALESPYAGDCAMGVGAEAIKRNMKDPNAALRMCDKAKGTLELEKCQYGVVNMYLSQIGSFSNGSRICELVDTDLQPPCRKLIAGQEYFFSVSQP